MANPDTLMEIGPKDSNSEVDGTHIDGTMRRIFGKAHSDVPVLEDERNHQNVHAPRRDFDTAIELLDRVSKAFDLLVTRFQRMQRELDVQAERAAARAAEQDHAIGMWERLASDLKHQVAAADAALVALQTKCEIAEARANTAEKQAALMETASQLAADQAFQA